jgi:pimeloyl-ACP methyl ester carboxylesterase
MAAMYPDAVERVVLVCAGVCLEEKDLAGGLFPVAGVGEAADLLVPRRPEEVRRLVRLTFVRPPCIMPSCFLWDYIKVRPLRFLSLRFLFKIGSKSIPGLHCYRALDEVIESQEGKKI